MLIQTLISALHAALIGRPVRGTVAWLGDNLPGLALGAVAALGIVGVMLLLRTLGRRLIARDPPLTGWKAVIANVLAKTTVIFMAVAAVDIVASYTEVRAPLRRGVDIAFMIVAALQTAIWARE